MITDFEVLETTRMFSEQHLDIRTITMGINLMDCSASTVEESCQKIYDKICKYAGNLVQVGEEISRKYHVPIIHKRISVTPISIVAAASGAKDYTPFAIALDKAAKACGVNFIGGFSALVEKGRSLFFENPEKYYENEVVANSCMFIFSDEKRLNEFFERDYSLASKIASVLSRAYERIQRLVEKYFGKDLRM